MAPGSSSPGHATTAPGSGGAMAPVAAALVPTMVSVSRPPAQWPGRPPGRCGATRSVGHSASAVVVVGYGSQPNRVRERREVSAFWTCPLPLCNPSSAAHRPVVLGGGHGLGCVAARAR